jgi:hypothetical protein
MRLLLVLASGKLFPLDDLFWSDPSVYWRANLSVVHLDDYWQYSLLSHLDD